MTKNSPAEQARAPRVIVVMPAYNAAKTLEATYRSISQDLVSRVILVDDVSHDNTVEIAAQLGIKTLVHRQNKGYGGNQKTCYIEALRENADIVVMLHPDNQYDATQIPELVAPIAEGRADMVLGSRLNDGKALERGMPIWKYLANRCLTLAENLTLGTRFTEFHSGFRAYSREFLLQVPFVLNSDDFVFDTEMLAEAVAFDKRVVEVFTPCRYFPDASSVGLRRSIIYGLKTLWVMLEFTLHKLTLVHYKKFELSLGDILRPVHWEEFQEENTLGARSFKEKGERNGGIEE